MDQQPQKSKPGSALTTDGHAFVPMAGRPTDMSRIPRPAPASQSKLHQQPVAQSPNAYVAQQPPVRPRIDPASAIGVAISRPVLLQKPIQQQQWPLPQASAATSYQPPPGKSQPPPRPPRTSKIISMVDNNQPQLQVPPSAYASSPKQLQPQDAATLQELDDINAVYTPSSRPSISSVGSIPEFPVPAPQTPSDPQPIFSKRATLGPPPSSRRGASSFYSTLSYVEPIPEETSQQTLRSRSSFASSAAIPDDFDSDAMQSSGFMTDDGDCSPFDQQVFDDRPSFMRTRPNTGNSNDDYPGILRPPPMANAFKGIEISPKPTPISNPFLGIDEFEGDLTESVSPRRPIAHSPGPSPSSGTWSQRSVQPVTPDRIRRSVKAATSINSSSPRSDRHYTRLSAIRRPPNLNIDAANSRTSTTSLPEMIRRATRLAYMIDRGKRPASKVEGAEFDFGQDGLMKSNNNGRQSGLSDMLAAFPPPAHPGSTPTSARSGRMRSFLRSPNSWPFPPGRSPGMQRIQSPLATGMSEKSYSNARARRFCGLPLWGFILMILVILAASAAAIVIPLQLLVLNDKTKTSTPASESNSEQCSTRLPCLNGGTSVILNGQCSCICVNGFTGDNCGVDGATGCTTTDLVGTDRINNVTLGLAIPRLIANAQDNYSVSLSGSEILTRFNSANLSCVAQNSLVTFDGSATRLSDASTNRVTENAVENSSSGTTTTAAPSRSTTPSTTTVFITSTVTVDPPTSTATYDASEDAIDFARVAVLFVLQETNLDQASEAQSALNSFFTRETKQTEEQAKNLDLGNSNFIDLVNFRVQAGSSIAGNSETKAAANSGSSKRDFGRKYHIQREAEPLAKRALRREVHLRSHNARF
ncbi:hypothetical protein HOO65_070192 [Ceratocystis lukuohia]|uniref:EGF-like domain-containing protein n=1 Tax=Ceratocystis lukuohia TaxID=2019550 RepID=A0ABR4MBS9_9PEZI